MKKAFKTFREPHGFTLAEVLAALVIASMILITVMGIYSRAESAAATIKRKFESSKLPSEVLQRIAEDIDRIITSDPSVKIIINNKIVKGYPTARLTITKTIVNAKKQSKIFENIVWQTNYDYDANGLVLYRQRTSEVGLLEDKLLDEERESWEQEFFVPICEGITYFKIQAVKDGETMDKWVGRMPLGIEVTISFAEPFKTLENTWDVYDEHKFTRTIAIDRTRKIKFKIAPKEDPEDSFAEGAEEIDGKEETPKVKEPGGPDVPPRPKEPGGPVPPVKPKNPR